MLSQGSIQKHKAREDGRIDKGFPKNIVAKRENEWQHVMVLTSFPSLNTINFGIV